MRNGNFRWRILPAILSLSAFFMLAGCAKIDVRLGDEGKKGDREQSRKKVDKGEAISIARNLARSEGMDLGGYKVNDKKVDDGARWVLFDRKGMRPGYPRHFAVYVGRYGEARVYKDR